MHKIYRKPGQRMTYHHLRGAGKASGKMWEGSCWAEDILHKRNSEAGGCEQLACLKRGESFSVTGALRVWWGKGKE